MVNEYEGYWDNTPDLNLPFTKIAKQAPQKKKYHEPRLIEPIGTDKDSYKNLSLFGIWLKEDSKLLVLQKIINNILNKLFIYDEDWNHTIENLFPIDLLRFQIDDKNLEEILRNDRRTFEILNTNYKQGSIRNCSKWLSDFKAERIKYKSNHPWPFIGSPRKLNLQIIQDIESTCFAVSYCHDLLFSEYPIFTDEQKKKLNLLTYPTYKIGISIIDNYISHVKCYIEEIQRESKTTDENDKKTSSLKERTWIERQFWKFYEKGLKAFWDSFWENLKKR